MTAALQEKRINTSHKAFCFTWLAKIKQMRRCPENWLSFLFITNFCAQLNLFEGEEGRGVGGREGGQRVLFSAPMSSNIYFRSFKTKSLSLSR